MEEMDVQDNGTKWEDGLKEAKGTDELTQEGIHYKINSYGDTSYCLPSLHRLLRDKFEGIRLRRIMIEGLSAEDLHSDQFCKLATPYEAISVCYRKKEGEDHNIVALRYKFCDDARQRRWDIHQAYPSANCMWGPEITDEKLKEVKKWMSDEIKTVPEWKHEQWVLAGCTPETEEKPEKPYPCQHGPKKESESALYRLWNHGILVNQLSEDLTEERLWELFPTAVDLWITHNFTMESQSLFPINHRYAFVEYPDDDAAASALTEVESVAAGEDGSGMIFYNYAQLRDATVKPLQTEEGRKVLSDRARALLVKHLKRNIDILRGLVEHTTEESIAKMKAAKNFPKSHLKDIKFRKKDTCKLVLRTVTILEADKKRRLISKGETYTDTAEQKAFINSALNTCKELVGKDKFEEYIQSDVPKVGEKRNASDSASLPASKKPKGEPGASSSRGGRGGASTGRGSSSAFRGNSSSLRGGSANNRGGFANGRGGGAMMGRGAPVMGRGGPMAGPVGRGGPMAGPVGRGGAPPGMGRGRGGMMGEPGSTMARGGGYGPGGGRGGFQGPNRPPMHDGLLGGPPAGPGRPLPPPHRKPEPFDMLESIKAELSTMTQKLSQVSSMHKQQADARYGYDYPMEEPYAEDGYAPPHPAYRDQYRDDGYGGGYY